MATYDTWKSTEPADGSHLHRCRCCEELRIPCEELGCGASPIYCDECHEQIERDLRGQP